MNILIAKCFWTHKWFPELFCKEFTSSNRAAWGHDLAYLEIDATCVPSHCYFPHKWILPKRFSRQRQSKQYLSGQARSGQCLDVKTCTSPACLRVCVWKHERHTTPGGLETCLPGKIMFWDCFWSHMESKLLPKSNIDIKGSLYVKMRSANPDKFSRSLALLLSMHKKIMNE